MFLFQGDGEKQKDGASTTTPNKRSSLFGFAGLTISSSSAAAGSSGNTGESSNKPNKKLPANSSTTPSKSTSVSKRRQEEDQELDDVMHNLDVTRLSSRLLLMGMLWKHRSEKRSHRINVDELSKVLNGRYKRRYLIWDLSGRTLTEQS